MDGGANGQAHAGSDEIISINPFRCRMWPLHDRLEDNLTESECRAEIESISKYGQLVPALGRRIDDDPEFDVELIYGARRWLAARHLNKPLRVQLRRLNDRDALITMDIENRHRRDISPYERGMSYARWIKQGHFSSQEEIAQALQVSTSQVSRLLKLARLPSVIVSAFGKASDILERWGIDLADAWEDHRRRPSLARKARALAAGSASVPARQVYEELLAASTLTQPLRPMQRDEVILGQDGKPLFRVRRLQRAVVLSLPACVPKATFNTITRAVADILGQARELTAPGLENAAAHASPHSPDQR